MTFVRNLDLGPTQDKVYAGFVDNVLKEDEMILANVHPADIPIDLLVGPV